jgi:hypothetical protein
MNAGSNATRANADMVQARTGAATLEAATTPAAARERFMRNLPSGITPAQASQLADMEEARGAFSRPGLNMAAILGATPTSSAPIFAPSNGAAPTTPAGVVSLLNQSEAKPATAPPAYAEIQRQIVGTPGLGLPAAPTGGGERPADRTPRELIEGIQRAFPQMVAQTPANSQQLRNLAAYLSTRYAPGVLRGSGGAGMGMGDLIPSMLGRHSPGRRTLESILSEADRTNLTNVPGARVTVR